MATILFIRQKTTFFSFLISKANVWFIVFYVDYTVFASAKILIRKQFTTLFRLWVARVYCFCLCKDINSKAIHNHRFPRWVSLKLFLPLQRY